jgi:hypothetical protein
VGGTTWAVAQGPVKPASPLMGVELGASGRAILRFSQTAAFMPGFDVSAVNYGVQLGHRSASSSLTQDCRDVVGNDPVIPGCQGDEETGLSFLALRISPFSWEIHPRSAPAFNMGVRGSLLFLLGARSERDGVRVDSSYVADEVTGGVGGTLGVRALWFSLDYGVDQIFTSFGAIDALLVHSLTLSIFPSILK